MLTAVNLNDKAGLSAREIREIRAYRQLPNELETVETACAKFKPESLLRIVFDFAQTAGTFRLVFIRTSHLLHPSRFAPHPNPLPARGERG